MLPRYNGARFLYALRLGFTSISLMFLTKMTSGCFLQQWISYDTLGFALQDDYPELCCLSTYLFVVSL